MPDAAYLSAFRCAAAAGSCACPMKQRQWPTRRAFSTSAPFFCFAQENLRLISVWHPSVLSILADLIERRFTELIRDLRLGAISTSAVPEPASRSLFARHLRPCPGRADYLESIDIRAHGFAGIWPNLKVLSCWADGWSAHSLPALAERFPQAAIQPKGLLATEGVVSIPIGRAGHRAAAVTSHFLEFTDTGDGRDPAAVAH